MRVQIRPSELKTLAPMSATISRLTEALHDINTKMSEIARLIELDTGLTANVLRWANSAFYGARMPVDSITSRVSIGCNFGAEVRPGRSVTFTISFQISSGLFI